MSSCRRTGLSRPRPRRTSNPAPENEAGSATVPAETTAMGTDQEKTMSDTQLPVRNDFRPASTLLKSAPAGGVPGSVFKEAVSLRKDVCFLRDPITMTIHEMEHNHQVAGASSRTTTPKQNGESVSVKDNTRQLDIATANKPFENVPTEKAKSKTSRKRPAGNRGGGKKKKKKKGDIVGTFGAAPKKKENWIFKPAFTNSKASKEAAKTAGNEISLADMSSISDEEKLKLSSWGLPRTVVNNYHSRGIKSLFKWQAECLSRESIWKGRNFLYSAPTSAGKTLIAEVIMIMRVLKLKRKAIMILPYKSVAKEKVKILQGILTGMGVRVEGFIGNSNPLGGFKAVDIAICTIEKANSLLNKLLEEDSLEDLGTLVIDELHMIREKNRGYLLELLLTKIMYMTSVKDNGGTGSDATADDENASRSKKYNLQVIGMSATLPKVEVLASWLKAPEPYETGFRPVPLKGTLLIGCELRDENLEHARDVYTEDIPIQISGDFDNMTYLTLQTVLDGFSVLIFCPSKQIVESTAVKIAKQFNKIGNPESPNFHPEVGPKLGKILKGDLIKSVFDQLKNCPGGSDQTLVHTVAVGVGYHHAGLTSEARDIVESAFKGGILKVIVSTTTLAAGVNLPARRVIISTPMFNGTVLDNLTYRQMCGRAGRTGIDTEGESILICPANLKQQGTTLFTDSMSPVTSALAEAEDGSLTSPMRRALLEAIASGIAVSPEDVRSYINSSFLFHSKSSEVQKLEIIKKNIDYLKAKDFIRIKQYEQPDKVEEYMATLLGSACLAASMSPEDGLIVHDELVKARECFVLDSDLHVIYQVTPIDISFGSDYYELWSNYPELYDNLTVSEKKVADLIGIKYNFIMSKFIARPTWKNNTSSDRKIRTHIRFYAALALSDLVNEKPLEFVTNKYKLSKGTLQALQQTASTFAGMVTTFCGRLGWSNLELLLEQSQNRLEYGVQRELCELVRLDSLNGRLARSLYDAGIKTVLELAAADPAQVEHILHKATPFYSDVHEGRESHARRFGVDRLSESEAAQKIVSDARALIQIEMDQFVVAAGLPPEAPDGVPRSKGKATKSEAIKAPKKNEVNCNESVMQLRSRSVSTINSQNHDLDSEEQGKEMSGDSDGNSSDDELLTEDSQSELDELEDSNTGEFHISLSRKPDNAMQSMTTNSSVKITSQISVCADVGSEFSCSFNNTPEALGAIDGNINDNILTVENIESADLIPNEFFSTSQIIGVGLKIVPSKILPTSLITHQRMGHSISEKTDKTSSSCEQGLESSIALYNGRDAVIALRWGILGPKTNGETSKLEAILSRLDNSNCYITMFDCKEKLKSLLMHCSPHVLSKLPPERNILDPGIAHWLVEFDDKDPTITKEKLINYYIKDENDRRMVTLSLRWGEEIADAVFAWRIMTELKAKLKSNLLWNHFTDTEMPSTVPLLMMEANGVGVESSALVKLERSLQLYCKLLELKAYLLAGRRFNLNSTQEVKKTLFEDMGLKKPKGKGTGKDILSLVDHDLAKIIIEYRKILSALQKISCLEEVISLETGRIHGRYSHYTRTGRVIMSDPNLQTVERDFDIMPHTKQDIRDIVNMYKSKFDSSSTSDSIMRQLNDEREDFSILSNGNPISVRKAFIPCSNEFTILAADYSHLELRILAHLSGDCKLMKDFNQDVDVFVEVASQWKKIPKEQVTKPMRQKSKTIVYSVINGTSTKTLSKQMDIKESEAKGFKEQFMTTYPGVKQFLADSVNRAQQNGHVETISGRRRYLSHIFSNNSSEQAKARRQAVNSQIQGSAADLVKRAMNNIQGFLREEYPSSSHPINWRKIAKERSKPSSSSPTRSIGIGSTHSELNDVVCFPILNLHDELVFEVRKTHLEVIAKRIKHEMESALKLLVKLPVVIKTGDSWGSLVNYDNL